MTFTLNGLEFNHERLDRVHSTKESRFLKLLHQKGSAYRHAELADTTDGRQLIYIDNNSSILGVAHLDGTMPASHFLLGRRRDRPNDVIIVSPFVDDRLGAYTLLDLLPQLDIRCDILFSVGEEIGQSTAADFQPPKQYNWMFQFDRMGTDVVHYQYVNDNWLNGVERYFEGLNGGIFSDISRMDHLGCQGMNIGTGYYDYTGPRAWASLFDLSTQVYRFKGFYDEFKDTVFLTAEGEPREGMGRHRRPSIQWMESEPRSEKAKRVQINL